MVDAEKDPPQSVWYGWQILIVDGVSISTAAISLAAHKGSGGNAGAAIGILGFLFGGPTVHWVHGHVGTGFASLGVRAAVPLVLVGMLAVCYGKNNCGAVAAASLVTIPAASAIDAGVFAYEDAPREVGRSAAPGWSAAVVPVFGPGGRATGGVAWMGATF